METEEVWGFAENEDDDEQDSKYWKLARERERSSSSSKVEGGNLFVFSL